MNDQKTLAGLVTLTNTKPYPFNDAVTTVALPASLDTCRYDVLTEVAESSGETGDVIVFGKAKNGFKLAFTGSAAHAVILYSVIRGDCHDCN